MSMLNFAPTAGNYRDYHGWQVSNMIWFPFVLIVGATALCWLVYKWKNIEPYVKMMWKRDEIGKGAKVV